MKDLFRGEVKRKEYDDKECKLKIKKKNKTRPVLISLKTGGNIC